MSIDIVRGELERLFSLDELMALSSDLLGLPAAEVGGAASKASFARALTDKAVEIDALEALIGTARGGVIMLLVIGKAEFAQCVFGAGIFGQHRFEVGDRFLYLTGLTLDDGSVIEGARIVGQQDERLRQIGFGVVVLLPGNLNHSRIGKGVGIVRE